MILLRILGKLPVSLAPDDNQRFWVAGNPLLNSSQHTAMSGDVRNIQRQSVVESGPDIPFTKKKDASNETLTITFTTSRTFASNKAAWQWRNLFSRQDPSVWPHPVEGDCVMRFVNEDGTFTEEKLHDCYLGKPTIRPNGNSLELDYTLTGGLMSESIASGQSVIPVAGMEMDRPAEMLFFGNKTGGGFTDDASPTADLLGPTMLTTYELVINVYEDGTNSIYEAKFYVRPSGGGSLSGYTSIDGPITSAFPAVIAALDTDLLTGEVVTSSGRSALKLSAVLFGDGGASSRIRLRVLDAGAYDGDKFGGISSVDVFPKDDAGDIPVADITL